MLQFGRKMTGGNITGNKYSHEYKLYLGPLCDDKKSM